MSSNGTSMLLAPLVVWRWYLDTLVHYQPGSWVASIAHTFRILAFLLIAPFAILTMLDVTSYVIARTLGVIDDTKASTSDKGGARSRASVPTLLVSDESKAPSIVTDPLTPSVPATPGTADFHNTHNGGDAQALFFNPREEVSLKLSGVGVFSPATSRPASPSVRKKISLPPTAETQSALGTTTSSVESMDESFTIIERGEEEEGTTTGLRKRGQTTAHDAATDTQ